MILFEFKKFAILILSIVLLSSCKKDSTTISLESKMWVESNGRTDTIAFSNDLMILNRPKTKIPYLYRDLIDSVELQNALSSFFNPKKYGYKIENNKLYITDFYNQTNSTLVFEPLK